MLRIRPRSEGESVSSAICSGQPSSYLDTAVSTKGSNRLIRTTHGKEFQQPRPRTQDAINPTAVNQHLRNQPRGTHSLTPFHQPHQDRRPASYYIHPSKKKVERTAKRHTTPGIRWSSPTQLLVWPSLACLWESGRDPEFSSGYGRMWKLSVGYWVKGDWELFGRRRGLVR